METGIALYKCKNCGTIYDDGTRGGYLLMETNFYSLLITGKPAEHKGIGQPFKKWDTHVCDENTTGVAELVGLRKKTE